MVEQQKPRAKEEYAIVMDFLQHGYPEDSRPFHKKEAIIQAIGKEHFTILELVPNEGLVFKPYDEVYIGEGKRDKISYIKGALAPFRLTQTAKTEMPFVIEKSILANEKKFVDFINTAGPMSLRSHMLELLPGIGKKHAEALIEERQKKLFESFDDIHKRVSSISDIKKILVNRVLMEIEGKDRYRLFVRV